MSYWDKFSKSRTSWQQALRGTGPMSSAPTKTSKRKA